jgi:transposase
VVVWADELTVSMRGWVVRIWAPIGEAVRQRLDVQWKAANLSVAVEPITGSLEWHWVTSSGNPEHLARVLEAWAQAGVRGVVWDGAGAHRALSIQQQAQTCGVSVIRQPPYAPELNPAERLIQVLRAAIEGRTFGKLEQKKAAVEGVLNSLALDPERVRRLTRWDWIHQSLLALPP